MSDKQQQQQQNLELKKFYDPSHDEEATFTTYTVLEVKWLAVSHLAVSGKLSADIW